MSPQTKKGNKISFLIITVIPFVDNFVNFGLPKTIITTVHPKWSHDKPHHFIQFSTSQVQNTKWLHCSYNWLPFVISGRRNCYHIIISVLHGNTCVLHYYHHCRDNKNENICTWCKLLLEVKNVAKLYLSLFKTFSWRWI